MVPEPVTGASVRRHDHLDNASLGRGPRVAASLLVVSAFGPYLSGGLRLDQAVVYTLSCVALAASMLGKTPVARLQRPAALALVSWGVLLATALTASLSQFASLPFPRGNLIAGLDNLVMPLALAVCVHWMARSGNGTRALDAACLATVVMVCGNAVLAVAQATQKLPTQVLAPWSPATGSAAADTVAELAGQLGRYSGVFNQPAEAGLAYSIAGVCAVRTLKRRPYLRAGALILITVGGFLCVSKVFLFVGVPVIAVVLVRQGLASAGSLLAVGVGGATLLAVGPLADWQGRDYLLRFLNNEDESLVDLATAGRLGGGGTLQGIVSTIIDLSPIVGVGVGGLATPYDNGWVEALVVSGSVGVLLYSLVLVLLGIAAFRVSGESRVTALAITAVAVGASVGLPALTANRAGLMLWLILLLSLYQFKKECEIHERGPNV